MVGCHERKSLALSDGILVPRLTDLVAPVVFWLVQDGRVS